MSGIIIGICKCLTGSGGSLICTAGLKLQLPFWFLCFYNYPVGGMSGAVRLHL